MIVAARRSRCRLGNRLELFTHLLAFSLRTGIPVAVPAFEAWAPYFTGTKRNPFCQAPRPRRPVPIPASLARFLAWLATVTPGLAPLLGGGYLDCPNDQAKNLADHELEAKARQHRFLFIRSGWQYRDWQGLAEYLPSIRDFFSWTPPLAEASRILAHSARGDAEQLIGVHIRRTDFAGHLEGRYYFSVERYRDWMKALVEAEAPRRLAFLICSDEAVSALDFQGLQVSLAKGSPIEDLAALSSCDAIMGPAISSFSGWAALQGNRPFLPLEADLQSPRLEDFQPSPLLGGGRAAGRRPES